MRSLIIIWLLVLITLVGGGLYVNNALGNMLVEVNTSVLTPQTSLEVVKSNSNTIEPKNYYYEDEIPMHETLQPTTVGNYMQHQRHYVFLQETETARALQGSFNQ